MKTKLLFLCSANIDRSPCAESLFGGNKEFEAKSAGLSDLAENPATLQLIAWADIIMLLDSLLNQISRESSNITINSMGRYYFCYG